MALVEIDVLQQVQDSSGLQKSETLEITETLHTALGQCDVFSRERENRAAIGRKLRKQGRPACSPHVPLKMVFLRSKQASQAIITVMKNNLFHLITIG
jgi:hypothetical protein